MKKGRKIINDGKGFFFVLQGRKSVNTITKWGIGLIGMECVMYSSRLYRGRQRDVKKKSVRILGGLPMAVAPKRRAHQFAHAKLHSEGER